MSVDERALERRYEELDPSDGEPAPHGGGRAWVLEAQGLTKAYGKQRALEDASLRVMRGEGVALLGPNGSGKTTLLCLLAGVLRASAGRAFVCGQPITEKSARRGLAFVPQDAAVYDGLTGAENIALFGRLAGLRGKALSDGIASALEAAELSSLRDVRARAYSGGMRRRLSLACALVHSPSVLLLDEPFEGVDDHSRDHLMQVLVASKRRGVALVLSTHRLNEVSALCERFCLLREGHIVMQRAIAEPLLEEPLSEPSALAGSRAHATHGAPR